MLGPHDPEHNHLLAALLPEARERIYPQLQLVEMPLGKVLYEPGDVMRHVYFPADCIVSLLYVMEDGDSAEISVVGNEGVIGISLFMGGETTPSRAVVQSAGFAYQLAGQRLKDEFHRNGEWDADFAASLYTSPNHTDGSDRSLQSASLGGPATVPLAAALPRPPVFQPIGHDPGTHRKYARRSA
jgi:hypothetical protein